MSALKHYREGFVTNMSSMAKSTLLVPALLVGLSVAWHFTAVALSSSGTATLLCDVAFAVLLAASVCASRTPRQDLVRAHVRGTSASIFLCILAAVLGITLDQAHPKLSDALMQPMLLGYSPSGIDPPFVVGVLVWSLSIAVLVWVGVTVGLLLRRLQTFETT